MVFHLQPLQTDACLSDTSASWLRIRGEVGCVIIKNPSLSGDAP